MKRLALTTLLLLMTGSVLGVVNQSTGNGDMAITATEQIEYNYSFGTVEDYLTENETGLSNYSVVDGVVEFEGVLETPTPPPCHILEERVEETSEGYRFHVEAIQQENEENVCPTVIAYQGYNASFEAEKPYKLEIVHDGETVERVEVSETEPSVVEDIFNWFRNLF